MAVEKPPSTSEMSAREAEEMADAMLRNSPLQMLGGAMEGSRRAVEVTSLQRKEVTRSFLRRKPVRSSLRKALQVNL